MTMPNLTPLPVPAQLDSSPTPRRTLLSPRQAEVIEFRRRGVPLADIAATFGCSKRTIQTHIRGARGKLGIRADENPYERMAA